MSTNNSITGQHLARFRQHRVESHFRDLIRLILPTIHGACLRLSGGETAKSCNLSIELLSNLANSSPFDEKTHLIASLMRSVREKAKPCAKPKVPTRPPESMTPEAVWQAIEPHFDRALAKLSLMQESALLLRYCLNFSLAELSLELGATEAQAKSLALKALSSVHHYFAKVGLQIPLLCLASALRHARHEIPEGMVQLISGESLARSAEVAAKKSARFRAPGRRAAAGLVCASVFISAPFLFRLESQSETPQPPVPVPAPDTTLSSTAPNVSSRADVANQQADTPASEPTGKVEVRDALPYQIASPEIARGGNQG